MSILWFAWRGTAMDGVTTVGTAFDEAVVFLSYFNDLQDPRQPGKVTYPLDEILLLCLLAVLAGAESFTEIALFGVKKLEFLRRFRPFKDGTPAHDHLGDILAVPNASQCVPGQAPAPTHAERRPTRPFKGANRGPKSR